MLFYFFGYFFLVVSDRFEWSKKFHVLFLAPVWVLRFSTGKWQPNHQPGKGCYSYSSPTKKLSALMSFHGCTPSTSTEYWYLIQIQITLTTKFFTFLFLGGKGVFISKVCHFISFHFPDCSSLYTLLYRGIFGWNLVLVDLGFMRIWVFGSEWLGNWVSRTWSLEVLVKQFGVPLIFLRFWRNGT